MQAQRWRRVQAYNCLIWAKSSQALDPRGAPGEAMHPRHWCPAFLADKAGGVWGKPPHAKGSALTDRSIMPELHPPLPLKRPERLATQDPGKGFFHPVGNARLAPNIDENSLHTSVEIMFNKDTRIMG